MIRSTVDASDAFSLPLALTAAVEIARALGDIAAARSAADQLGSIAADDETPFLHALADSALGAVLLSAGAASDALVAPHDAARRWNDLGAPYDVARARTLIGLAHAALGDRVTADLELDAARDAFATLGAAPDLARVDALRGPAEHRPHAGLTDREQEVLRAVAAGRTNREIAGELTISEHTVARHVQNIFTKIDVRSRAAATAYAYENHLV
jgi:DNA-binding CsgD family transcriptional regulator